LSKKKEGKGNEKEEKSQNKSLLVWVAYWEKERDVKKKNGNGGRMPSAGHEPDSRTAEKGGQAWGEPRNLINRRKDADDAKPRR